MNDKMISCDDHLDLAYLPADLWTGRMAAALRDRAPYASFHWRPRLACILSRQDQ
jgi:hypothetical protein